MVDIEEKIALVFKGFGLNRFLDATDTGELQRRLANAFDKTLSAERREWTKAAVAAIKEIGKQQ